jgi:hypothetical protein
MGMLRALHAVCAIETHHERACPALRRTSMKCSPNKASYNPVACSKAAQLPAGQGPINSLSAKPRALATASAPPRHRSRAKLTEDGAAVCLCVVVCCRVRPLQPINDHNVLVKFYYILKHRHCSPSELVYAQVRECAGA